MSTQVNTYVMCGVKLPYDKEDHFETLEVYYDSAFQGVHHYKGLCIVDDGMSGEYMFIGRVLAKTKDHQHFDVPMAVSISELEKELIASLIETQFGIKEPAVQVWVFSHYR